MCKVPEIWTTSWENPFFALCEQQRHRLTCASTQSDQHLGWSLSTVHGIIHILSKCKISRHQLVCIRSWSDRFECYLVTNPQRWVFLWRGSFCHSDILLELTETYWTASSEFSTNHLCEHLRSLARTSAACLYKQWVKRNLQTESQIPGPSEWLRMRN